jgi:hypothetical protein
MSKINWIYYNVTWMKLRLVNFSYKEKEINFVINDKFHLRANHIMCIFKIDLFFCTMWEIKNLL